MRTLLAFRENKISLSPGEVIDITQEGTYRLASTLANTYGLAFTVSENITINKIIAYNSENGPYIIKTSVVKLWSVDGSYQVTQLLESTNNNVFSAYTLVPGTTYIISSRTNLYYMYRDNAPYFPKTIGSLTAIAYVYNIQDYVDWSNGTTVNFNYSNSPHFALETLI